MSGASALAAAKRRRAVPTEPTRPPQKIQERDREPRMQPNPGPQVQTPAQNPLHLLLQHEQRVNDLERSLSQLKVTDPKPNVLTPDTLQYFKTQHDLMNQELNELKKILIKVQTFSMETNLEVLKMKKLLKSEKQDSNDGSRENAHEFMASSFAASSLSESSEFMHQLNELNELNETTENIG